MRLKGVNLGPAWAVFDTSMLNGLGLFKLDARIVHPNLDLASSYGLTAEQTERALIGGFILLVYPVPNKNFDSGIKSVPK